jgi:multidrug resistance efflux pump
MEPYNRDRYDRLNVQRVRLNYKIDDLKAELAALRKRLDKTVKAHAKHKAAVALLEQDEYDAYWARNNAADITWAKAGTKLAQEIDAVVNGSPCFGAKNAMQGVDAELAAKEKKLRRDIEDKEREVKTAEGEVARIIKQMQALE